jgi:hypothetical protein
MRAARVLGVGTGVGVAAIASLALAVFPSAGHGSRLAEPGLVWSPPGVVDRVEPTATDFTTSLSCPFERLCLAVDSLGNVFSTGDPTAPRSWTRARLPASVSPPVCPSIHLCLAVNGGTLLVSTHPRGGPAAWRPTALSRSHLDEPVCPSARLCVVAVGGGHLFTTDDPAGGRKSWHLLKLGRPIGNAEQPVSCPTTRFCAVTSVYGLVFTSTNPLGGRAAWTKQHLVRNDQTVDDLLGVLCPSAHACVVQLINERLLASTTPATGPWHTEPRGSPDIQPGDISCPSARLCVALGASGGVLSSTSPATGPWRKRLVDPTANSIWCRSARLCFVIDNGGHLYASSNPAGGASDWHETQLHPPPGSIEIACPSAAFCLAEAISVPEKRGPAARWFSSSDPATGSWKRTHPLDGYNPLTGATCASDGMCAVIDAPGDVLTSTNLSGGRATWHGERVDAVDHLNGVSCASRHLCVAVDQSGGVHVSSDPTAKHPKWAETAIDRGQSLTGIDCPSDTLCLAVDGAGKVLTATNPTGGAGAWHSALVQPDGALDSVSCPSAARCLVGGARGEVFRSSDSASGHATWRKETLGVHAPITSLGCGSRTLCLAVDAQGGLLSSKDPWGSSPRWNAHVLERTYRYSAYAHQVACASATLCLAVVEDNAGSYTPVGLWVSDRSGDPARTLSPSGAISLPGANFTAAACRPQTTTCIAVDDLGEVLASH